MLTTNKRHTQLQRWWVVVGGRAVGGGKGNESVAKEGVSD